MTQLQETASLSSQISEIYVAMQLGSTNGVDPFIFGLTAFTLACFVGYFVVWKVTPALHTPLMSVTNAISSVIVVGAIIALGSFGSNAKIGLISFIALTLASVNIFGGFVVTWRMLKMFKRK